MTTKYLNRVEASAYLKFRGVRAEKTTLQKYATVGGGPAFRKFGNQVLYDPADLDAWVEQKLSAPRHSTSEGRAAA